MTKDDAIDHAAGIVLEKKTGDFVRAGEPIAWLHTNSEALLPAAETRFRTALQWAETAPVLEPLIYETIR